MTELTLSLLKKAMKSVETCNSCKKCRIGMDSHIVMGFALPMCKCKAERARKTKRAKEAHSAFKKLMQATYDAKPDKNGIIEDLYGIKLIKAVRK